MRLFTIFLTAAGLCTIAACTKDIGPNPDLIVKEVSICDSVSFATDIQPIFNNYCNSCHFTGSGNPGDFTGYTDIKTKADAGLIKQRVIDQTPSVMPQGGPPLPQAELDLIKCWLEAGAPNN